MYICEYCHEEYIPARRHIQKYCSNSCRSKAYHIRNKKVSTTKVVEEEATSSKKDAVSLTGVSNAALGTVAANTIKTLLTKEENKPATKGDLAILADKIGRYHKIKNIPVRNDGAVSYFDMETNKVVYFMPSKKATNTFKDKFT